MLRIIIHNQVKDITQPQNSSRTPKIPTYSKSKNVYSFKSTRLGTYWIPLTQGIMFSPVSHLTFYYPVSKCTEAKSSKLHKTVCCIFIQPATQLLKVLGQIPVVESYNWLHAWGHQIIQEIIVVFQSCLADVVDVTCRQNARPGQAEVVMVYLQHKCVCDAQYLLFVKPGMFHRDLSGI